MWNGPLKLRRWTIPSPFVCSTFDTTIAGESINGKKVVIKRVAKPQDALSCRILFISSSEESRLKEIVATLDKTSVLTVSDIPQFTRRGGMIQFVVDGNKVRFEVNLTVAERAGLILSSQLLKVAISVRRSPQAGD
ncbi:MAG: YfiR family protein [Verrucomicrobia bacterium]|nr:MAG: YfiR family protein [Verrucomicrobiota bacterium]